MFNSAIKKLFSLGLFVSAIHFSPALAQSDSNTDFTFDSYDKVTCISGGEFADKNKNSNNESCTSKEFTGPSTEVSRLAQEALESCYNEGCIRCHTASCI